MEAPEPKPRLRPRFSLLSLLLLTAVVALSLSLWGESSRRLPLQREIEALRREVGEVSAADPRRMYVQPLERSIDSRMHFRWRAYVPPGRSAEVTVEVQQLDENRMGHLTMRLEAGETGFEFAILPSVPGTLWMYQLGDPASERRGATSGPKPPWLANGARTEGIDFKDFDAKPGVPEGQDATLMDLVGNSDDGQRLRVIVKAKHYPEGSSPNSSFAGGHRKIAAPSGAPRAAPPSAPPPVN